MSNPIPATSAAAAFSRATPVRANLPDYSAYLQLFGPLLQQQQALFAANAQQAAIYSSYQAGLAGLQERQMQEMREKKKTAAAAAAATQAAAAVAQEEEEDAAWRPSAAVVEEEPTEPLPVINQYSALNHARVDAIESEWRWGAVCLFLEQFLPMFPRYAPFRPELLMHAFLCQHCSIHEHHWNACACPHPACKQFAAILTQLLLLLHPIPHGCKKLPKNQLNSQNYLPVLQQTLEKLYFLPNQEGVRDQLQEIMEIFISDDQERKARERDELEAKEKELKDAERKLAQAKAAKKMATTTTTTATPAPGGESVKSEEAPGAATASSSGAVEAAAAAATGATKGEVKQEAAEAAAKEEDKSTVKSEGDGDEEMADADADAAADVDTATDADHPPSEKKSLKFTIPIRPPGSLLLSAHLHKLPGMAKLYLLHLLCDYILGELPAIREACTQSNLLLQAGNAAPSPAPVHGADEVGERGQPPHNPFHSLGLQVPHGTDDTGCSYWVFTHDEPGRIHLYKDEHRGAKDEWHVQYRRKASRKPTREPLTHGNEFDGVEQETSEEDEPAEPDADADAPMNGTDDLEPLDPDHAEPTFKFQLINSDLQGVQDFVSIGFMTQTKPASVAFLQRLQNEVLPNSILLQKKLERLTRREKTAAAANARVAAYHFTGETQYRSDRSQRARKQVNYSELNEGDLEAAREAEEDEKDAKAAAAAVPTSLSRGTRSRPAPGYVPPEATTTEGETKEEGGATTTTSTTVPAGAATDASSAGEVAPPPAKKQKVKKEPTVKIVAPPTPVVAASVPAHLAGATANANAAMFMHQQMQYAQMLGFAMPGMAATMPFGYGAYAGATPAVAQVAHQVHTPTLAAQPTPIAATPTVAHEPTPIAAAPPAPVPTPAAVAIQPTATAVAEAATTAEAPAPVLAGEAAPSLQL